LTAIKEVEQQGRCKLTAVCIVNRAHEAATWDRLTAEGVRCFESTGDLWNAMKGEIDLTLLPTPPQTHRAMTEEALAAGSHVLCEKPTSTNVADALAMEEAATSASRNLYIGFQDMYLEGTHTLKRELCSGQYGMVQSISFLGLWPRGEVTYYARNSWAGKMRLNGTLINDNPVSNAFAHFLKLGLFFAGPDATTSARPLLGEIESQLHRANPIETFDTAALRIPTDTGIPMQFLCSHAIEQNNLPTLRIRTDRDQLDWKYEEGLFIRSRGKEAVTRLPKREEGRVGMLEHIIAHLHGEPAHLCTPTDALIPLSVSESLREHPVRSFPESLVITEEKSGDRLRRVKGLAEKLTACFEENRMPTDLAS
jgi:predicted dehydrogenase